MDCMDGGDWKRKKLEDDEGKRKSKYFGKMENCGKISKFFDVKEEKNTARKRRKVMEDYDGSNKIVNEFIAPPPAKYRERFKSTCNYCFELNQHCKHYDEKKLKLLLIGHNPSDHAWKSGFFYSNPSNRMWKLLRGDPLGKNCQPYQGVVPKDWDISKQNTMPSELGIGFTDIGNFPGSDAGKFGPSTMKKHALKFFSRLKNHMNRVEANNINDNENKSLKNYCPSIVAFTGKRQFKMMFQDQKRCGDINYGIRTTNETLPHQWPFPRENTIVWILPSSSGRAAMTHEERYTPYLKLAQAFHNL